MQLITEINFDNLVTENSGKDLFIEGVFMQAEKRNKNGRIYPLNILEQEVDRYRANEIDTNISTGELNHPTSPAVNPERASHLITKLQKEGNNFIGKAKVLDTPMGNIVKGLLDGGVRLGVSSRGLGSVREGTGNLKGVKVIQPNFHLVTVDIVSNPSGPDCWLNGIHEGFNYVMENGKIYTYEENEQIVNSLKIIKSKKISTKVTLSEADKIGLGIISLIKQLKA